MDRDGAVLFDLDRTLCVRTQDEDELLRKAFDRAGIEQYCSVADLVAVSDDLPTAESDVEFYELGLRAVAEGTVADPDDAPAVARAYDDLVDHSAVDFRPGARAALEAVRENYAVALVTNGGRETQTTKLEALGIADAFDATVFADPKNGVEPKPDPEPFRRALSALDVAPENALHVGDSLSCDVEGANRFGLSSVWVPFEDETNDAAPTPTYILDSPGDLPALL
ncbi:MAG TPA: HAD family hydrolase [Natrialbaceae archaeon]|nr:HAD family hydrolase [Natrialbaceae archaeon]